MNDRQYKDTVFGLIARVGKGVSSPKRIELLDVLAQGPRTVEVLADEAGQTVANASQHLKVLRAAGLVEASKSGLFVTYRVAGEHVVEFFRALRKLAEERMAEIERVTRTYLASRRVMETIDRKELVRRVRAGEVAVLDVRPRMEYRAGHLPGALSIPLRELLQRLKDIPKSREIVAYCRGPYCVLAVHAVKLLRQKGFRAFRLEDGVPDWRARGLPVAVGE